MKWIFACLCALVFGDAVAYVDPGTGSMILQVFLGGLAAVGVIIKLYWHKFTGIFRSGKRDAESSDP